MAETLYFSELVTPEVHTRLLQVAEVLDSLTPEERRDLEEEGQELVGPHTD